MQNQLNKIWIEQGTVQLAYISHQPPCSSGRQTIEGPLVFESSLQKEKDFNAITNFRWSCKTFWNFPTMALPQPEVVVVAIQVSAPVL